jgi:tetratricopeptide (TPR) repeat protein
MRRVVERLLPVEHEVCARLDVNAVVDRPRSRVLPVVIISASQLLRRLSNRWSARRLRHTVERLRGSDDALEYARALRDLGDVLFELQRTSSAEACLVEALAILRSSPGARLLDLARTLRGLALIRESAGDDDVAERLWEEACRLYGSARVNPGVAESASRLALLASRRGDDRRGRGDS